MSNSGETQEVIRLLEAVQEIGLKIMALTGKKNSTLARHSDMVLDIGDLAEACPLGLAPSATTTAMLAVGDALKTVVRATHDVHACLMPGQTAGRPHDGSKR